MRAIWMIAGAIWAIWALVVTDAWAAADAVELPNDRLEVTTPGGSALLPVFLRSSWDQPQPEIERALIIVHGLSRNGRSYFGYALDAAKAADAAKPTQAAGRKTFVVAPQFLIEEDVEGQETRPKDVDRLLRWWRSGDWSAGLPARRLPARLSSFDAMDAIMARLADRKMFPSLSQVVLAGHSAGGQFVQRYAILGKGLGEPAKSKVSVRYVVANPSSYAYLKAERPRAPGGSCQDTFDNWKFGLNALPPYAVGATVAELRRAYLARDVVYLLGTNDDNPNDDNLDRGCEANAQGRNRLSRGASFFAFLQQEHPSPAHRLQLVHGISHSAKGMFTSPCGLAILFDIAGCGWSAARP